MKLLHFCSKKLEEAEEKVTLLIKESGGKFTQQPFEVEKKEDA
jgi:exonuclease VII small subunit